MEKEKENKKELQITVAFDEKKLEAMTYFMEEKKVTLESAMQDHLKELYEKYVPTAMRRYLSTFAFCAERVREILKPAEECQGMVMSM